MLKSLTLFATLAACAIIIYALWNPASPQAEEEHEHHAHDFVEFSQAQLLQHAIDTSLASSGTLQHIVRAPAKIVIGADQMAHILPKAPGIAQAAYKNLGEKVKVGELIAVLESREMAEAKSALLTANKKEQLTNKTFQREENLYDKKISSTQEYNLAKSEWESAIIDQELARQKLHALGLHEQEINQLPQAPSNSLRAYELRSPISGNIIARHITLGESISTDQEVYIVADLSKVWAEINLFSQDRPYISINQKIIISTTDGRITQAKVVYLSPIIDEDTRTSKAIAEIDNSRGDWLPGMYAQAKLIAKETPAALIIPRTAVQNIDGADAIFVASGNGFSVRPITIGDRDEISYEVISGLTAGETYASNNTFLLKAELEKDEAEHMD